MAEPLMPKATAVWLIDNTTLTFEQIAAYTGLHSLEVQGIADGEVAIGIQGIDPIANSQLTRDEIVRCEKDPKARLKMLKLDLPDYRIVQDTHFSLGGASGGTISAGSGAASQAPACYRAVTVRKFVRVRRASY